MSAASSSLPDRGPQFPFHLADSGQVFSSDGRASALKLEWLLRLTAILLIVPTVVMAKLSELETQNGVPTSDAGVFATIGSAILRGQVPYRDLWDHKPPGIFYLNAVILGWLSPTPWDYHLLEIPLGLLTVAAFYWLLRTFATVWAAVVGACVFTFVITAPTLSSGGDLTETYLPLVTILAIGLTLRYASSCTSGPLPAGATLQPPKAGSQRHGNAVPRFYGSNWCLVLVGLCCGCAMLLKPQSGLDLGLVEVLVLHRHLRVAAGRIGAVQIGRTLAAGLVPVVVACTCVGAAIVPLIAQGAGPAMWSQLVVYNSLYSRAITFSQAAHLLGTSGPGILLWLPVLFAGGVVLLTGDADRRRAVSALRTRHGQFAARLNGRAVTVALLAWTAIGVVETAADRHFWGHDFLMSAPSAVALGTLALQRLHTVFRRWKSDRHLSAASWAAAPFAFLLALTWAILLVSMPVLVMGQAGDFSRLRLTQGRASDAIAWNLTTAASSPNAYGLLSLGGWTLSMRPSSVLSDDQLLAQHIVSMTNRSDYVFIWGRPLGSYFLSGRRPASRYLYFMPLVDYYGVTAGERYATPQLRRQFINDLVRDKPRVFIVEKRYAALMRDVPDLTGYLRHSYRKVLWLPSAQSASGFELYRRRS